MLLKQQATNLWSLYPFEGFLCQGFPAESAAKLAVFIHGKCADTLLHEKGYRGLIASDLISRVPPVLAEYELKKNYG